jgi:hypothetical protein
MAFFIKRRQMRGAILHMEADSGGDFQSGGGFRGGFNMEADFRGRFQYGNSACRISLRGQNNMTWRYEIQINGSRTILVGYTHLSKCPS